MGVLTRGERGSRKRWGDERVKRLTTQQEETRRKLWIRGKSEDEIWKGGKRRWSFEDREKRGPVHSCVM